MKLWQKKGSTTSSLVEQFTVGRDKEFDIELAKYDVIGSMAHCKMLHKVGLLKKQELTLILKALQEIKLEIENKKFKIEKGIEDIHSQVEKLVTERYGEVGKKIHTGRSRNDQIALDSKLYYRDQLVQTKEHANALFKVFINLAKKHQRDLLPGYTHYQLAMPSSFGLWFSAYAESLIDDVLALNLAYQICDRNPLGSGAGYGSSFPLDRLETTKLLGFSEANINSIYAQMGRTKAEKYIAFAISSLASTLAKFAMDCCLYINQNFQFISFPDHLTTGSSLMPHKKNPDVFELIRAKCNRLQSIPNEINLLTTNLASGYHRDVQLLKEIIFPAFKEINSCIELTLHMLEQIQIRKNILNDPQYKLLFTVDALNEEVKKGMPFREAYQKIGNEVNEGTFNYKANTVSHTHLGSIGNLGLNELSLRMKGVMK